LLLLLCFLGSFGITNKDQVWRIGLGSSGSSSGSSGGGDDRESKSKSDCISVWVIAIGATKWNVGHK